MFGEKNSYKFFKMLLRERFGFEPLDVRSKVIGLSSIKEVRSDHWKGFSMTVPNVAFGMKRYMLWDLDENNSIEVSILIKENAGNVVDKQIIESLHFSKLNQSTEKYFNQGMTLYSQRKYIDASYLFGTALYLDWENIQHQYQFAILLNDLGLKKDARKFALRVIEMDSSLEKAKDLQQLLQE